MSKAIKFTLSAGLLLLVWALSTLSAGATHGGLHTEDLTGPLTPFDLADSLAGGSSVSGVSGVTYTGADAAAGVFTGGGGNIGLEQGVILSSGNIASVIGPNVSTSTGTSNGTAGDASLDTLSGFTTFDAAVLEFDFTPTASTAYFRYVFASEEYNEWVNTQFNDVFAFFVNDFNCATVSGLPVSINTINNGDPSGDPTSTNPAFYRDNTGAGIDTEMDGLTVALTCTAPVNPGVPNHIKLAIADASDRIYDAAVFLEGGSFVSAGPGDADCLNGLTLADSLHVQKEIATLGSSSCIAAGNIKCDDPLNLFDALIIQMFIAGLNPALPQGCPPPTPS